MRHERSCPHCGVFLTKPRSGADHRRLFAIISKAFIQWPSHHHFRPRDAEHLRAFLLVSAEYTDVEFIPVAEECAGNPAIMALVRIAIEATFSALTRRRGYAELRVTGAGIEILTPRSIDFATLDQKAFGPVREAVETIIEGAIGVKADQLLKEEAA